ncbi:MAG: endolytic transglycosylase MltG [Chloroflexi bacterium]|nr:endolytic transglycosylase MltG [Chloroflexota bacterium]MBI3341317.1 endolytic transglycosylase MltG [Chloroflexota bacterium]
MRRFLPFVVIAVVLACIIGLFAVSASAAQSYGPPASSLGPLQVIQYSAKLVWYDGLLTRPLSVGAPERSFTVQQNESVGSIVNRLAESGLIVDASAFRDYLIYTGLDTSIQAGDYKLSPAMSIVDIARAMQDATPADVTFVVLPGWRMEEIALSLPTSGLDATPEAFIAAALSTPRSFDFMEGAATAEGFLYPDVYILPRETNARQLVETLVRNFSLHLTIDLRDGFARQGLTVYQAVTLASIVAREAVREDETPTIASVYLNRLKIKMKLDADPTVQYALGFNSVQKTWWTNPLSLDDLKIDSPFNTYLYEGLPPAPVGNPDLNSLRAVAFPADTTYYFFRAKCDGSGYHIFSETLDQQIQNACP